ncbi:MAG: sialidase family protein [Halioglobus sp.]
MIKPSRIQIILHGLSALSMAAFVYFFVSYNAPGFTRLPVIALLGGTYVALFLLSNPGLLGGRNHFLPAGFSRILYAATALGLPVIFLNATVLDYYQPVSLHDNAIFALAGSWLLLIVAAVIGLFKGHDQFAPAATVALLGTIFILFVQLISNPAPSEALKLHADVFVGGEDGYDTYRIPALLVLPAGSQLANGTELAGDRVLVMAEARLDGDLDTGAIDLVQKISEDGGNTWSQQRVLCTHQIKRARGKCGNATPVFDAQTGVVWLAYNLSGVGADKDVGHSAYIMKSEDGGSSWLAASRLPYDGVVFGPGHGIQKQYAPAAQRLLLPGNKNGESLVIISDDHGNNWAQAGAVAGGNENEIAELADGSLYMTLRHMASIGRPPKPNGRLYSRSSDGGQSWLSAQLDTALPTPISQASVAAYSPTNRLLFSNPADTRTRVQMTVRASVDGGETWLRSLLVYPGPAGYSELAAMSNGDVALFYERGDMEYSEMISFGVIPSDALLLTP